MHLPPDGLIGRHPTAVQQLFAVVTGEAEVSGTDGAFRTIGPGYAALWEIGEEHETRSTGGCTAICIEGRFEMWATAVTKEIVVADHDPAWADWFVQLRDRIWPAAEAHALRVDHVGSTAVPGLAAKPVIDMDIVVADESKIRPVIEALRPLGYQWRGDLGVEGRQALRHIGHDDLPQHHLYLVVDGSAAHLDHVLLRDLLRADAEARDRYGALKKQNVALADGDMDVYLAAKHDLVQELLQRARDQLATPPTAP
jgi:GrpB-like predicted nucleotidyltransferase (UPF0157 family)